MASRWYSNLPRYVNAPGSENTRWQSGTVNYSDLEPETVDPVWMDVFSLVPQAKLMKLHAMLKGKSKRVASLGTAFVRQMNQDFLPVHVTNQTALPVSAAALPAGQFVSYMYLDNPSAVDVRTPLFIADTGEIVVVKSWQTSGAEILTGPPSAATYALGTTGVTVIRARFGTTQAPIPAGARLTVLPTLGTEGGRRSWGGTVEPFEIFNGITLFRMPLGFSNIVQNMTLQRGVQKSATSRKTDELTTRTIMALENAGWFGRSSWTTTGGYAGITSEVEAMLDFHLPQGTAIDENIRSGAGIFEQIADGGLAENMNHEFDREQFGSFIYALTSKTHATSIQIFCGRAALAAVARYYEDSRQKPEYNEAAQNVFETQVQTIKVHGPGGVVNCSLIPTPAFDNAGAMYENCMVALDTNNLLPFHLGGLDMGGKLVTNIQEPDVWSSIQERRGSYGWLLSNRRASGVIWNVG